MDLMGAGSPMSNVPSNIKSASAMRHRLATDPEYAAGLMNVEKLDDARVYGSSRPAGYGHQSQGLQELIHARQRQGAWSGAPEPGVTGAMSSMTDNPKPKGFTNSLKGNMRNIAADLHFTRFMAMASNDPEFLSGQAGIGKAAADAITARFPKAAEYIAVKEVKGKPIITFNAKKAAKEGAVDLNGLKEFDIPSLYADKPNDAEYAHFEDFMKEVGDELGMTPAQTQAALWMGAADRTGLDQTSRGTFMDLFRRRVGERAAETGRTFDDTLRDFIRNKGLLSVPIGIGAMSMQSAPAEAGSIEELDQKYAEGGKVNTDDELDRALMLRDLELMAEPKNPNAVAPRKADRMDLGVGLKERLALINKYLNPVEAIGESMDAGSRMMSPGVSGYDRVAALGDMLSGVAGVVGPMAVAKRVGAPAANAVADMARKYAADEAGSLPSMGRGQPDRFGENWDDVYHWSRSPENFSEFDPNKSTSAMSQLGPHVGTQGAAEARYMGFAKPEGTPPAMGYTMPMKADLRKPFLNPATGKPWTEMDLEMFISAVSDVNNIDRKLVAPFMRERLAKEGYTSIPYMNDVEDAGSVSHIMLTERPASSDAVLRSRFAKFDPAMRNAKNLSAGVAAGTIGASQYDPDAIEATATRVRENKFAAGGAVKYDPAAVDGIINKLREVNRG